MGNGRCNASLRTNRRVVRLKLGAIGAVMAQVWQWMGVGLGLGVVSLGLTVFFRGLSLPPNAPEHRPQGIKGEDWRT